MDAINVTRLQSIREVNLASQKVHYRNDTKREPPDEPQVNTDYTGLKKNYGQRMNADLKKNTCLVSGALVRLMPF